MSKQYKKIVIKTGTNVLTNDKGVLDMGIMKNLVSQIAKLKKEGIDVIMVSSGALGAGKSLLKLSKKFNKTEQGQIYAATGQVKLMTTYSELLKKHDLLCGQLLATKSDFRDRTHYLNMKNCIEALLKDKVIPIANENDAVSVTDFMFTDNDEMAGLIASMINVDALILLTNVDGIMDKDPKEKDAKVIKQINPQTQDIKQYISSSKSSLGRGGMETKYKVSKKLSEMGITTHIANGKTKDIILKILKGEQHGTTITSQKSMSNVKKWLAHSKDHAKGTIYINECLEKVLKEKKTAVSILPVGITKVEGDFEKGDIIEIKKEKGKHIGLGQAQYDCKKAKNHLGKKGKKEIIHCDYLFLKN